jgi:uncharacterized protein YciI
MRNQYFVVQYGWRPEDAERIVAAYPQHRAHVDRLGAGGGLLQIGVLLDDAAPTPDQVAALRRDTRSRAVFSSRASAEAFTREDPYVTAGLISTDPIRAWEPLEYPGPQAGGSPDDVP